MRTKLAFQKSEAGLLRKAVRPSDVMILASAGMRFTVVACDFEATENDWDIFESPVEFRSQYRAKP
jgi:hypothetical protein